MMRRRWQVISEGQPWGHPYRRRSNAEEFAEWLKGRGTPAVEVVRRTAGGKA